MVVSMSDKEFSRLNVLLDVQANRLRIDDAAQLLNLKRRQIFRLLKAMREVGPAGLASKRRGRPSNNRLPTPVRELTMSLVKAHYADFGPTLALEKLTQFHSCPVSRETLRKWMIEDGLWIDRKHRLASVHQPRNRRERLGELIQIDGCKHYWFENRGPECTLLAFIDDATSRIMHAAFVPSESTLDYLRETKAYVTRHGRPIAFYSDKHAIFRVNNTEAAGGTGMTQFGRALHELNIDIICANTPQAKGRVERSFSTLQDRFVKELRLANICDLASANAFLPAFLTSHNSRFGKIARSGNDAHRPMDGSLTIEDVFAWKEERTLSHNLTVQYDKILYMLEPNEITRPLARQRVTIIDYPDGRLAIQHNGRNLPYATFDKLQKVNQAAIVENKRLGEVLAFIAAQQQARGETRSKKAPRRQGQADRHMFKAN
jgi:Winged helix-turn helix